MNTIYNRVCLLFLSAILFIPAATTAQNEEDLSKFLSAGKADASKLISAYTQPMITSLSYGMTGGWYNTAKAHKTLGFDLGVTVSAAFMPTSENYFNPQKLGLSSNVTYENLDRGNNNQAPTIFGPKDENEYTFSGDLDDDGDNESVVISGPEGFNLKKDLGIAAAPVPMIQLGVGIIKNTDLKVRFIPKQTVGSSEISMFGIGVMHDIKQHIKGIKLLPFDLSALVAYNSVKGSTDLRSSGGASPDSDDGKGTYKFNSWVIQGIISKKVSVLTFYAGVGYNMVKTNVDVTGTYTINASPAAFELTNPVSIDFKNNSMRFTAGMRLKLGPVYFNGDYTLQKYNTLSLGFGFSVR